MADENDAQDLSNNDTSNDDGGDLGEKGLKALQQERTARKEAERSARAAQKQLDDLQQRLTELEDGQASEQEKAIKKAQRDAAAAAKAEVASEYQERILTAAAVAAATGIMADPQDAVLYLDLGSFDVDADDLSDTLKQEVEKIVEDKPYLSANGKPKVTGDGDGGPRTPASPTDENLSPRQRLTRAYADNSKQ